MQSAIERLVVPVISEELTYAQFYAQEQYRIYHIVRENGGLHLHLKLTKALDRQPRRQRS